MRRSCGLTRIAETALCLVVVALFTEPLSVESVLADSCGNASAPQCAGSCPANQFCSVSGQLCVCQSLGCCLTIAMVCEAAASQ